MGFGSGRLAALAGRDYHRTPRQIAAALDVPDVSRHSYNLMRHPLAAGSLLFAVALGASCRYRPSAAPTPAVAHEDYCWAYVQSSPFPADSVAARFANAFTVAGLTNARWDHQGDTAWATAAPTELPGPPGGVQFTSRVVGYQKGTNTHYRLYVTVQAPPQGWQVADTADGAATRRIIGACSAIAKAAGVHATTPRAATGEESLSVWARK